MCRKKIRVFKSMGTWYVDVPVANRYHEIQLTWTFSDALEFAVSRRDRVHAGHSCD